MVRTRGIIYGSYNNEWPFEKTFENFDEMYDYLYSHSRGVFTEDGTINLNLGTTRCMNRNLFVDAEEIMRIFACRPGYDSKEILIELIESERGIEFSSGDFTGGKKHASKAYREWALNKMNNSEKFNFAD